MKPKKLKELKEVRDSFHYKIVLLPVSVPRGEYCWGLSEDPLLHRICPHFSNEGGHPVCDLDLATINYTPEGFVKKPKECLNLREESWVELILQKKI